MSVKSALSVPVRLVGAGLCTEISELECAYRRDLFVATLRIFPGRGLQSVY